MNPFPKLQNLCILCLASQALAQWQAPWGIEKASASLRRGVWGIISPSSHALPIEDSSSMAKTWG